MKTWEIRRLGGPGSGHYGHKGRKGQVGGSTPGTPTVPTDQVGMDKWWPILNEKYGTPLSLEGAQFDQSGRKGYCDTNALRVFKRDPEAEIYYGTMLRFIYGEWRPMDGGHYWNVKDGKIIDISPFTRNPGEFYYFGIPLPGVTKSTSARQLWALKDDALSQKES